MSRIKDVLSASRQAKRAALLPYIAGGDPAPELTVPIMHAMVQAGADLIELGVPFSDPMADGPTIQKASERALKHGVSLSQIFSLVAEFRKKDSNTPVILMGYMNPMEVMGVQRFCELANQAGVDGVLTVDLPPEEAGEWLPALADAAIDPIFLIAPTTDKARIQYIQQHGRGYLYYVSLKGVTGSNALDKDSVANKISEIRGLSQLPIAVGFGIKDAASAADMAQFADAVVVGSALVSIIEKHAQQPQVLLSEVSKFVKSLRDAIDHAAQ